MSQPSTILFHGNCIDGWFSAYFAFCQLQHNGPVQLFPIAPSQPNTWPSATTMKGSDIWLLDVSVPAEARNQWMEAGAASIQCIDHHATAIEHWPADKCPIHTDCCAALQTWKHFYPDVEVPEWLHSIDRVDRWVNVTYEDRCLREYLHDIARKPVQRLMKEAFDLTYSFVYWMGANPKESLQAYCQQGRQLLAQKDAELMDLLKQGIKVTVTPDIANTWQVPHEWIGKTVFLIDTTMLTLDTTEASHLVFIHHAEVDIFINYRDKSFWTRENRTPKSMVVYSARSRTINLTEGTIFKGHPTSAGATLLHSETNAFPFRITRDLL
jgi:hypothetical protein